MTKVAVAAVDLGSSSGRVVVGTLDGGSLALDEVHRFPHEAHGVDGDLAWDLDDLEDQIGIGVTLALADRPVAVRSVSVDSWGVDYVLLDPAGQRLGPAHAYRDPRTARVATAFYARASREERWAGSGVKPDDINTGNQLFADLSVDPHLRERVGHVLLLPDYFAYRLSGELGWGRSICSTSGLCEPGGRRWSADLLERSGIPAGWFGAISADIAWRGPLCAGPWAPPDVGVQVVNGAGHDTACAVHALPKAGNDAAAFISSGSWSIVGVETDEPVLDRAALEAGFTNEARADGGNRLIANITGLWILQECQRAWRLDAPAADLAELLAWAERSESLGVVLDTNDPTFMSPGQMPAKIAQYCRDRYDRAPSSRGQIVRLILESLAVSYAAALVTIEAIVGRRWDAVHLVGGGAYNRLLCQMTASATAKVVIAGPAEASAVGNVLAQLEVAGVITSDQHRHDVVRASFRPHTYTPGPQQPWLDLGRRLKSFAATKQD